MKSCVEVEETPETTSLSFVILQDDKALAAIVAATGRCQPTEPRTSEVAKGHCWEDLFVLTAEQQDWYRGLFSRVDPWELQDSQGAERDGIAIRLRCDEPGRSHMVRMSSPSKSRSPAHYLWVTSVLDLAACGLYEPLCAEYLACLRPYFPG